MENSKKKKIILTSDIHYECLGHSTRKVLEKFFIKIKKENPDILILAGDIISHKQKQFKRALKLIRLNLPNIPILLVRGNHDFWNTQDRKKIYDYMSMEKIFEYHERMFKEFNIQHLSTPYESDNFAIVGFDGWYGLPDPPSSDEDNIPHIIDDQLFNNYFHKIAQKELDKILYYNQKGKKLVVVTHFDFNNHPMSANMSWFQLLMNKCDILCVGHSHKKKDITVQNHKRILNCGSDYNDPKYLIFYL